MGTSLGNVPPGCARDETELEHHQAQTEDRVKQRRNSRHTLSIYLFLPLESAARAHRKALHTYKPLSVLTAVTILETVVIQHIEPNTAASNQNASGMRHASTKTRIVSKPSVRPPR